MCFSRYLSTRVLLILNLRWDMGLAENGGLVDAGRAGEAVRSAFVNETAKEAAERSTLLMRDRDGLPPLSPDKNILLVEQIFPTQERSNNVYSHPALLWEELSRYSQQVGCVEIPITPEEADRDRVRRRLEEAEVMVATNYYYHKTGGTISPFIRELAASGKPVVVVSKTPYAFGAPEEFGTVAVCFNPGGRECMAAVAKLLFGRLRPTARLNVNL